MAADQETERYKPQRIPVKIEKVLELEGAHDPIPAETKVEISVYAHISTPVKTEEGPKQYALLAKNPQDGFTHLGFIDSESREFITFVPAYGPFAAMYTSEATYYDRAVNHVINRMYVPADQFGEVPTVDEVLQIKGLRVIRELIPQA